MIKINQNYDKLLQEIEDLKKQIKALNDEQVKQRRANEDLMYNLDNDNLSPTCVIRADHISLNGKTIDLTSGNITINSTNFSVDSNGNMTCTNATVGGVVQATGGSFTNAGISNCSIDNCTANTLDIKSGCELLSDATDSSIKKIPVGKQTIVSGVTYGANIEATVDSGYSQMTLSATSPTDSTMLNISKDGVTIWTNGLYQFRFLPTGMQFSSNGGVSWQNVNLP